MIQILQILQIILGCVLVLLIIIHSPKGDGIGAIGSATQLFSSQKGAETGLNKTTGIIGGSFILLSLILSLLTFL